MRLEFRDFSKATVAGCSLPEAGPKQLAKSVRRNVVSFMTYEFGERLKK